MLMIVFLLLGTAGTVFAQRSDSGVAGLWESNWGPVSLSHEPLTGSTRVSVTGSWDQQESSPGVITSGTYDPVSRQLDFKFYQAWNEESGEASLKLSEDADRLEGPWSHSTGSGIWSMTRQRPPELEIGKLSVTFRNLLDRAAQKLTAESRDLSARRAAIDSELLKAVAEASEALKAEEILKPRIEALDQSLGNIADFIEEFEAAGGVQGVGSDSLTRNRGRHIEEITAIQEEILAAERGGKNTTEREAELASKQQALDAIDAQIMANQGSDEIAGIYKRLVRSVQTFRVQHFELQRDCIRLSNRRLAAEAKLRRGMAERGRIDQRLLEIGQTITGLDFDLAEIKVSADGKQVFHATSRVSIKELDSLNMDIEKLDEIVDGFGKKRQSALDEFLEAGHAASDSLNNVANLLARQAWEKFFIDWAFSIFDVVYRGGQKGGLVGMVGETLNKVAQAAMFEYDWSPLKQPPGQITDPVSIEAEVKRQFEVSMKDSLDAQELGLTAGKRMLKDTVFKYAKDTYISKKVGASVYENVEIPWRLAVNRSGLSSGVPVSQLQKALAKAEAMSDRLRKMKTGYSYQIKNLAEGVTKDLLKTGMKAYLESVERDAWRDFFEKDIRARMLYPVYRMFNVKYWEAVDARQEELERKATIVSGYDPSGFEIDHSEKFDSTASLVITLMWRKPPAADSAGVLIGGRRALGSGTVFQVSTDGVDQYSTGMVELTIN